MSDSLLNAYLRRDRGEEELSGAAVAFYAGLDHVRAVSPGVAEAIVAELRDQRTRLKLIASENYSSLAVQLAQGNLFTDKYAEGFPGKRFYAGCENVDAVESEAVALARRVFGAEHAYLQPHSGADANLVAFAAILATRVEPAVLERLGEESAVKASRESWQELRRELRDQRLLALDYYSGGHLTHGYRHNISSRLFDAHTYSVNRETKRLDLGEVRERAREVRPTILLGGYSAYTRLIDFAALREIADEVGAVLMVDMAHFSGLVAGGVFGGDHDPVPFAQVITSTTHKTLRGPRGGMVLCDGEFAAAVDKGCPAVIGGPLPQAIAAKAVALREAAAPEFASYARRVVDNARALAEALQSHGVPVLTGGTDNHIVLVDVAAGFGLTGWQGEAALGACGLTMNRNAIPFDANGPWYTSGLRLGTPAVTTLGMGAAEMEEVAATIATVLAATEPGRGGKASKAEQVLPAAVEAEARDRVAQLLGRHPVYPELDLDLMAATEPGRAAVGGPR